MVKFEDVNVGDEIVRYSDKHADTVLYKGKNSLFVRSDVVGHEFSIRSDDLKYYTKKQEPVVSEIELFRTSVGTNKGKLWVSWKAGEKAFTLKITETDTETTCELIPYNPPP